MQTLRTVIVMAAAAAACMAQQWEFGGSAGGSFLTTADLKTLSGSSATAGMKPGAVFGAYLGQNLYNHVSGEIRYEFVMGDLRLKSGGSEATFGAQAHMLHYDVLLHTGGRDAVTQFFAVFGGGMKVFRGTGTEVSVQPLSQFAYLTKTQEVKPMGTIGAGVRMVLAKNLVFRAEIRDFITPFPSEVITPAMNASLKGNVLHNIVPMASLGLVF